MSYRKKRKIAASFLFAMTTDLMAQGPSEERRHKTSRHRERSAAIFDYLGIGKK